MKEIYFICFSQTPSEMKIKDQTIMGHVLKLKNIQAKSLIIFLLLHNSTCVIGSEFKKKFTVLKTKKENRLLNDSLSRFSHSK